jgi:hypothetical protein
MEDANDLLGRLKLGREEYCQRLLTMLILDAPYPPWNTHSRVSDGGVEFLARLDALSFGDATHGGPAVFIDEFDLPKRHDNEKGSAPDWAVLTEERVWMVELKTEAASHRAAQIPGYFELARHHYPDRAIDLTYLTPPLSTAARPLAGGMRFAHVVWADVVSLVATTWSSGTAWQRDTATVVIDTLASIGTPWTQWRQDRLAGSDELPRSLDDLIDEAVTVGRVTAGDGQQRALDYRAATLDELQQLRLTVKEALAGEIAADGGTARPWLWNTQTSGGAPMTQIGAETGYELRFSKYRT